MSLSDEAQRAIETLKRLGIEVESVKPRRKLYVVAAPGAPASECEHIQHKILEAIYHEQDNVVFVFDKPVTVQVIELGPIIPDEEKKDPDDYLS